MDRREFIRASAAGLAGAMAGGLDLFVPSTARASVPMSPVVIQRCWKYDVALIEQTLRAMFDMLKDALPMGEDVESLVKGRKVAMKINGVAMTGSAFGRPNFQYHDTHWAVCLAAGKVFDAYGASEIKLIESQNKVTFPSDGRSSFDQMNYPTADFVSAFDCKFENTTNRGSYADYMEQSAQVAGVTPFIFDSFLLNPAWCDADTVYVSIPKMKNHAAAGVTLGMKNLMGMPPHSWYGSRSTSATDPNTEPYIEWNKKSRGDCIHKGLWDTNYGYLSPGEKRVVPPYSNNVSFRLPRVICDENTIRPMHLTICDAINGHTLAISPNNNAPVTGAGCLIAGRNTVCADAVSAAVMGYNPDADHFTEPFYVADNHLRLAREQGLGTNKLSEIELLGEPLEHVRFYHQPKKR